MSWHAWVRRLPIDGAGLRLVSSPHVVDRADEAARTAALSSIGYSTVRATDEIRGAARRAWLHRHVALVMEGALTPVGRAWLRDLAMASPRPHLVLHADAGDHEVPVMRERAGAWDSWGIDPRAPTVTDARGARARACERAGRHDAALLWLRAAVGAAARRGDEPAHACALEAYGRAAMRTSAPTALRHLGTSCRHALAHMHILEPRSRVIALLCEATLRAGLVASLPSISAWLSGIEVECRLAGVEVPPWIAAPQVDVAIWDGQWDAALRAVAGLPPASSDALGRTALVAWLRHDREGLQRSAARLSGRTTGGWAALAALLAAAGEGGTETVRELAAVIERDWTVPWARAAAVEALRCVRRADDAAALLARARRRVAPSSLEGALLARLAGDSQSPDVRAGSGVHGMCRWGERRESMTMWGGVSALIDEVNNAEDDRAALKRGCRWVRTHTGTGRVVVTTAGAGAVLVADPVGARPGDDDVRAPIHQGGVTIGWVVAAQRARDADELAGCVRTLAAVCAPAVRACIDVQCLSQSGDVLARELLGRSPAMAALRAAVARAAPTTFPVLIEGESGVGKELVARALHRLSARRDRRLAAINCAALTDELFEAEVFGHTRGAFTGAVGARTGLFEDAHQGSVFLDEVGELSPRAQAKLLRVLQEGEIRRVGDNQPRAVDVRIIAATNRPLAAAVASGAYREDLLFRLAVVRLTVPPLRERLEDVPGLAQTFWADATRHRDTRAWLAPDAIAALCRHHWPGNVRELQNVMAGLVLAAPERGRVTARHVATVITVQPIDGPSLDDARRALDRRLVADALARHAGCRAAAARDLGVSRQGFAKLMARLNLPVAGVASGPDLR